MSRHEVNARESPPGGLHRRRGAAEGQINELLVGHRSPFGNKAVVIPADECGTCVGLGAYTSAPLCRRPMEHGVVGYLRLEVKCFSMSRSTQSETGPDAASVPSY